MKSMTTTKLSACALAGLFTLLANESSHAAIVAPLTPEIPGVLLGAVVPNFGGTHVSTIVSPFAEPGGAFAGSLQSTVVRNAGGTLDFYYQLANTSTPTQSPDPEVFRLTLESFYPLASTVGASYETFAISNGLAGITGAPASISGTNVAYSADRDPGIVGGGFGFDFGDDQFIDDVTAPFTNLLPGQTSNFLVIRSTETAFRSTQALAVGAGTGFATALTPIPEPATILVGLALTSFVGYAELGRKRRRKSDASKA